jgi:hypothetical protein
VRSRPGRIGADHARPGAASGVPARLLLAAVSAPATLTLRHGARSPRVFEPVAVELEVGERARRAAVAPARPCPSPHDR